MIGAEGASPEQGFALHPLGEVVFEFAVAAGHPLTALPMPLPASAIQGYPTVIAAYSSRHLPVSSIGLLNGRSRIYVPGIEHKIEAQCRWLGVGYLLRHRVMRELAEGQLALLTLDRLRPPEQISVA